jgi:hypothetical protein
MQQAGGGGGRIEHRIAVYAQRSSQARAQMRLGGAQLVCAQYGRGNARLCVERGFALDFRHLFSVCGDPECACLAILDGGGEGRRECAPKLACVASQCPLGGRIVHGDDVPHARCRGAAAGDVALDDDGAQFSLRASLGAGCADDARAHDEDIGRDIGRADRTVHDAGIPWRNGSASSKNNVV